MGSFLRILAMLPKNMAVPAVVLAIGWYGGAKYGAPDFVMNNIDSLIAEGGEMIGGVLGGGEDDSAAPSSDGDA